VPVGCHLPRVRRRRLWFLTTEERSIRQSLIGRGRIRLAGDRRPFRPCESVEPPVLSPAGDAFRAIPSEELADSSPPLQIAGIAAVSQ